MRQADGYRDYEKEIERENERGIGRENKSGRQKEGERSLTHL